MRYTLAMLAGMGSGTNLCKLRAIARAMTSGSAACCHEYNAKTKDSSSLSPKRA